VTRRLGEAYADRLLGVHFDMLFALPTADDPEPMDGVTDAEETRFAAAAHQPWSGQVDVPTGYAHHPYELMQKPRAWAEQRYRIAHWKEQERGGHFGCFERTAQLVEDLRAFRRIASPIDDSGSGA
jgi:hypothetical protein